MAVLTIQKSFTFGSSSLLLPVTDKNAVQKVYAFCRKADDLADEKQSLAELSEMKENLVKSLSGKNTRDETVNQFSEVVKERGLDEKYAFELLEGLHKDLLTHEYQTFYDLEKHCYAVASTVGLLLLPILSDQKPNEEAIALGKAMQLTNILRDVAIDLKKYRVYLPQDELELFNADASKFSPEFKQLMRFQIERARSYYAKALPGIMKLKPSARPAVSHAIHTYAKILDEIETRGYKVI